MSENTTTVDQAEPFVAETRQQAIARYREQFPLLAAYQDIVDEHNSHPINEPMAAGVSTEHAAALALARIGRPARDREDAQHADAYVHRLMEELDAAWPVKMGITDYVIDAFLSLAGFVPTKKSWLAQPVVECQDDIDEILSGIPVDDQRHVLKQALWFAMPILLKRITMMDKTRPVASGRPTSRGTG